MPLQLMDFMTYARQACPKQARQKYMLYRYGTSMALKRRYPIHSDTSIDTDLHTWCLRLVRWGSHPFDLRTTSRIILICSCYYLVQNPTLFPVLYTFYHLNGWRLHLCPLP